MAKTRIDIDKLRELVADQKTGEEIAEELGTELTTGLKNHIYKALAELHAPEVVAQLATKRSTAQVNIQPTPTKNGGINLPRKLLASWSIEGIEGKSIEMDVSPEKDQITLKLVLPEKDDAVAIPHSA